MYRFALGAAALGVVLIVLQLVSQGQREAPIQLLQRANWGVGALAGTGPLVTLCARGNNAACDKLAANPAALGALQTMDASNPTGFAATHPNAARKMRYTGTARMQGLLQEHNRQGLYMGDHWGIEGIDSMPKDESTGNSMFDFGVMAGTPRDPQTGMPLPGTLDNKYIKDMTDKSPWLFDIDKIRRNEDGVKPKEFYTDPPFNYVNQMGYVFGRPRVDIIDGHVVDIDDGTYSSF